MIIVLKHLSHEKIVDFCTLCQKMIICFLYMLTTVQIYLVYHNGFAFTILNFTRTTYYKLRLHSYFFFHNNTLLKGKLLLHLVQNESFSYKMKQMVQLTWTWRVAYQKNWCVWDYQKNSSTVIAYLQLLLSY